MRGASGRGDVGRRSVNAQHGGTANASITYQLCGIGNKRTLEKRIKGWWGTQRLRIPSTQPTYRSHLCIPAPCFTSRRHSWCHCSLHSQHRWRTPVQSLSQRSTTPSALQLAANVSTQRSSCGVQYYIADHTQVSTARTSVIARLWCGKPRWPPYSWVRVLKSMQPLQRNAHVKCDIFVDFMLTSSYWCWSAVVIVVIENNGFQSSCIQVVACTSTGSRWKCQAWSTGS